MKTLIALLLILPSLAFANTQLELQKGKTEFLAVGNPGFLKINGKGAAPQGKFTVADGKINGTVTVDLKSLDTGMALRNTHMKEKYLQVDQFPEAKLEIKDQPIANNWSLEAPKVKDLKIPATITIHGQSQPVTLMANIDDKANLESTFEVTITDFKIEIPSFMGVTVADKVKVSIESKLVAMGGAKLSSNNE